MKGPKQWLVTLVGGLPAEAILALLRAIVVQSAAAGWLLAALAALHPEAPRLFVSFCQALLVHPSLP